MDLAQFREVVHPLIARLHDDLSGKGRVGRELDARELTVPDHELGVPLAIRPFAELDNARSRVPQLREGLQRRLKNRRQVSPKPAQLALALSIASGHDQNEDHNSGETKGHRVSTSASSQ